MKLSAFLSHFGSWSEAFWTHYPHPHLLQDGDDPDREVYTVRGGRGSPVVLGRDAPCDVRIADARVSSRHALTCPPRTMSGLTWPRKSSSH